MANIPTDRKYTKDHEWVATSGKDTARVGITDYAQRQLGDIVFVELPKKGDRFEITEPFGSIESVKSVSETYMPLTGTVATVNEGLHDEPEQVNDDPYGDGWMIEITFTKPAELNDLLTAAQYEAYIAQSAD
ncbi:glycine cleavage system protein GcvH [Kitasatospora sp. CM 4170]|uniref:Glycine cleavage system H protein n=1 Tax=Kitasatospora aburaviensis TaxID=67265 RepID=A0ABW1EW54_9ACTN|nr:glycine cleavage system protein GcvH [Kitasatospora sp. CM 4170]WNM46359.1 glycine cleavage system protein GcvH [Kitasatospora sp. CM 4170]